MRYAIADTAWGPVLFATSGTATGGAIDATCGGLRRLLLPLRPTADDDADACARARATARRQWPGADYVPNLLPQLQRQIQRYFDGQPTDFRIKLDLRDRTLFHQTVLRACATIPYGETLTYGQLAELAGRPGAARAVGSVMAANRWPLIVPCHRVVQANGNLGAYSAPQGIRMKRRLLDMEAAASVALV
ncbi:MAG: methylated-DNA--[protein]-cysteine S-methyltransferase [Planctomycetes bacterium]|nr:methylated-DNA--[protein]-cysteine S-methyltransferase [Planctomycetota bacterium]